MKYPKEHKIARPFVYVPACATDIKKTFARVKRLQGQASKPVLALNYSHKEAK